MAIDWMEMYRNCLININRHWKKIIVANNARVYFGVVAEYGPMLWKPRGPITLVEIWYGCAHHFISRRWKKNCTLELI